MSIFELNQFELSESDSPLVISVPHDGALIPSEIKSVMNPDIMGSSDRDLLIDEVFNFSALCHSKIKANFSRHVIDLNRPSSGASLYSNRSETELCPTTTFDYQAIYQSGHEPSRSEIQRRTKLYWKPYHEQLAKLIQNAKDKFGFCLLIDAHSIDDEVPRFFSGKLPEINVGTFAGQSCSIELECLILNKLNSQKEFSFVSNDRFKGGYITRNYGNPGDHIHAIQLEHSKRAYLNKHLNLSKRADLLRKFWQQTLTELIELF